MESIQLARPTLDVVFLTLTGRSLRDDSPVGSANQPGENDDDSRRLAAADPG
jgi:hypothetical protein